MMNQKEAYLQDESNRKEVIRILAEHIATVALHKLGHIRFDTDSAAVVQTAMESALIEINRNIDEEFDYIQLTERDLELFCAEAQELLYKARKNGLLRVSLGQQAAQFANV